MSQRPPRRRAVVAAEPLGVAGTTPAGLLAPDDDALAAILAAVAHCVDVSGQTAAARAIRPGWTTSSAYPWRFSGRWWSGPAPLRRERPGA